MCEHVCVFSQFTHFGAWAHKKCFGEPKLPQFTSPNLNTCFEIKRCEIMKLVLCKQPSGENKVLIHNSFTNRYQYRSDNCKQTFLNKLFLSNICQTGKIKKSSIIKNGSVQPTTDTKSKSS